MSVYSSSSASYCTAKDTYSETDTTSTGLSCARDQHGHKEHVGENNGCSAVREVNSFNASGTCLLGSNEAWGPSTLKKVYMVGNCMCTWQIKGDKIIRPGGSDRSARDYSRKDTEESVALLRRVDYQLYVSLLEEILRANDGIVLRCADVWGQLEQNGWTRATRVVDSDDASNDWQGMAEDAYLRPGEYILVDYERNGLAEEEVVSWLRLNERATYNRIFSDFQKNNTCKSSNEDLDIVEAFGSSSSEQSALDSVCDSDSEVNNVEIVVDGESSNTMSYNNAHSALGTGSKRNRPVAGILLKDETNNCFNDDEDAIRFIRCTKVSQLEFQYVWRILECQGWQYESGFYYAPGLDRSWNPVGQCKGDVIEFLDNVEENKKRDESAGSDDKYEAHRALLREKLLRQYYINDEEESFIYGTSVLSLNFLNVWNLLQSKHGWRYNGSRYLPPPEFSHFTGAMTDKEVLNLLDGRHTSRKEEIDNYCIRLREAILRDHYNENLQHNNRKMREQNEKPSNNCSQIKVEKLSFNHGQPHRVCDVCFRVEGSPVEEGNMFSPFVKCSVCDLVVHFDCFEPHSSNFNSTTGEFLCDCCDLAEKLSPQRTIERRLHNDSLVDAGISNEYQYKGKPVKCLFCLRNNIAGGLKPTAEGDWAHLFCMMSTKSSYYDHLPGKGNRKVVMNCKEALKENKADTNSKRHVSFSCFNR